MACAAAIAYQVDIGPQKRQLPQLQAAVALFHPTPPSRPTENRHKAAYDFPQTP
jgi:hypothetical protein